MKPIAITSFLAVIACAVPLGSAAAKPVHTPTSGAIHCDKLDGRLALTDQALVIVSSKHRRMRAKDTWGAILLGIPMGSMVESDLTAKLAQLRSEKDALIAASRAAHCG